MVPYDLEGQKPYSEWFANMNPPANEQMFLQPAEIAKNLTASPSLRKGKHAVEELIKLYAAKNALFVLQRQNGLPFLQVDLRCSHVIEFLRSA